MRHRIGQRPEQVSPGDRLTQQHLVAARLIAAGAAQRLGQQAADEVELDREARAALELKAVGEARARIEAQHASRIAVDEDVLPRDEDLVQDEDRIVFIETR